MLIRIMYKDDKYDMVKPFSLDKLIMSGKIKKFLRSEGWVTVGVDPIRGHSGGSHEGQERRTIRIYHL